MSSEGTNLHTMWFMFQDAAKETQVVSSDMNLSADARPQVVPGDMNLSSEASTAVKPADLTLIIWQPHINGHKVHYNFWKVSGSYQV